MMMAAIEFEDRLPALEMVAMNQIGRLELRQHPVDRSQTDLLAGFQQPPIDVLRGQVARFSCFEYFQYLHARQSNFQPCALELLPLGCRHTPSRLIRWPQASGPASPTPQIHNLL